MKELITKLFKKFYHIEFLKFGIIGVINTVNHQILYFMFKTFMPLSLAHLLGMAISMIGSFYMNCYFTYKQKPTFKKAVLFPMTYLPTLIGSTIGVVILELIDFIPENYISLVATLAMIPFSYLISSHILKNDNL
jgi:putative flippase GtrA